MFSNGLATGVLAVLLAGSQLASAHMEISFPPPLRSRFNTLADPATIDYTNTAPLDATGANYPCKGYQVDIGTASGASVATFNAGGAYNFTVVGGAPHGGGSCQVSLSYDGGKTFTVIQSIVGGCPLSSNYPFTIPSDAPSGAAIWAWTWSNTIGNREQYMNCASVTIGGAGAKRDVAEKRATAAFSSRPSIFLANIGNGCSTVEGKDVDFPNPGPDVVKGGSNLIAPVGSCGSGSGSAGNAGSVASSSAVQATTAAPAAATSTKVNLPGYVSPPFLSLAPIKLTSTSGVFVTVAPTTTLQTSVVKATPTSAAAAATSSAAAPAATGGSSSTGAGALAQGTKCTNEGAWNCIAGKQWQRCASGAWSAVQPVAPGTACVAGISDNLNISVASKLRRRFRGVREVQVVA